MTNKDHMLKSKRIGVVVYICIQIYCNLIGIQSIIHSSQDELGIKC